MAASEAAGRVTALLDDSFCLALIATRAPHLRQVVSEFTPGALGISPLTVAALMERARTSHAPERNRAALEQFLLPLEIVEFGARAAASLASLGRLPFEGAAGDTRDARLTAALAFALDAEIITCAPDRYLHFAGPRLRALDGWSGLPSPVRPRPAHHRLILAMGSHDLSLDLLGERLHALEPGLHFCTAHVGSLEGVLAIQRGEAHLAGSHLLDEETGDYNGAQVRRLLAEQGRRALLVAFVRRMQGLMVAAGNPKQIRSFADMARDDVTVINRQPGAGTRLLLDHGLRRHRLPASRVRGYARECASHTAVAAAVAAGDADCGLGIEAAAHAQGLGFVPLHQERYDLLIPVEHYEGALLAPLRALLQRPDPELLRAVNALGGYSTEGMGRVLAEY